MTTQRQFLLAVVLFSGAVFFSGAVLAVSAAPTLTVAPAGAQAGNDFTATWSGIVNPTPRDWIGLYTPNAADGAFVNWVFVSGSRTPGNAIAAGSCNLTVPAGTPDGTYQLRLYANNSFTQLATSSDVSVGPTLSCDPRGQAGSAVTVSWEGISNPTARDWIGLFRQGAGDTGLLTWVYVSGSRTVGSARASGSVSFTIPCGLLAGAYEFRLFADNRFRRLATSPALTVELTSSVVVSCGDGATIQEAINSLPPSGGEVKVLPGRYVCTGPIIIDRPRVALRGSGPATVLSLATGANSPLLILGQAVNAPSATITDIHVSDLVLDGNRAGQSSELWSVAGEIRNNGICIRRCEDVLVERVWVRAARSGGVVCERVCRRITVRQLRASGNFFDGLAAYLTEDSVFSGLILDGNDAAGMSLDLELNRCVFSDAVIAGNGTVGIFIRSARDNAFHGVTIRDSRQHGIFIADNPPEQPSAPAVGNVFSGLVVSASGQAGVRVNDASCTQNLVVGAQLVGNLGGCVSQAASVLVTGAVVCRP